MKEYFAIKNLSELLSCSLSGVDGMSIDLGLGKDIVARALNHGQECAKWAACPSCLRSSAIYLSDLPLVSTGAIFNITLSKRCGIEPLLLVNGARSKVLPFIHLTIVIAVNTSGSASLDVSVNPTIPQRGFRI